MELGINRMVSTMPMSSEPPIATRLELLRRRQRAWRDFKWQEQFSVEFSGFVHGAVLHEYLESVYSYGNHESVSFIQLRPSPGQEKAISWSHSVDFLDCTTDATQDLLILATASPEG